MKQIVKRIIAILMVVFISLSLTACGNNNQQYTRTDFMMDTVMQVTAYGKNAKKAVDESMEKLKEIDNLMSSQKNGSDVEKINENAGKKYVKVNPETFYVIKTALKYGKISGGNFDITIAPLANLWGIGTNHARVPSESQIKEVMKYINYRDVLLNAKDYEVKLKKQGMAIDLGGIAKGYAADEIENIMKKNGIKHALINLGGSSVYMYGSKPDGSNWNIGIQDPFGDKGKYFAIVSGKDMLIDTSGNYERYFIQNGKRYHHILNPFTGYPAESGVVSTTIVSTNIKSIDADALSTITFILGVEKGMKLIESMPGVDAIFVTPDYKVYATSGLKGKLKITDSRFKLYENR
ncbi:FAD:protein FMN transferase [Thermoanaerobacterium thermosaccharolyticum]|jgi:FAD:protein FMN transferase|uniref:FAD:protein FMN transferase n=1 Tax=Thermoanaerobacterium thermosaccharolyticum M0795 TaxID=698948 RepID=L0IFR3_THETR|nr:FAD:protein FMN transferase [Thermoanaerobacterium thermosaccharolyticum]AGB18370.1 membrane-associated lipoprotein involved in thiamine biosynthesis [Thermoanaerobacterium thermosaccharolyticum M0795]PHO08319.1 thiamine biosynthesis protein ApbE [Thermoanaerobacterium thermosaccharolyticum]